jgi:hypothetical protein
MGFFVLLVIFGLVYFRVFLPLFQLVSKRMLGRKIVVRLGTPWQFSNKEHRWDVLLSFVSSIVTLGVSIFLLDLFFPLGEIGP